MTIPNKVFNNGLLIKNVYLINKGNIVNNLVCVCQILLRPLYYCSSLKHGPLTHIFHGGASILQPALIFLLKFCGVKKSLYICGMENNTITPTQQTLINDKAAVKIFKNLICKKKVYETTIFNTKVEFVIKTVTVKPTSHGSYPNTIVFTIKVLCHHKKRISQNGEWFYQKYNSTPYDVRRINKRLRCNFSYLTINELRLFSLDYPNVIHSSDIKIEWK